ncbi:MAG: Hsp20/alpha crystallin family protein [Enterococcus sp.]|nr:Hsp20/alpha crystallin family protein [Enterococcus sp.]
MNKELTHRPMPSPFENFGMSFLNSIFNDPLFGDKPIGTIHGIQTNDTEHGREYFYTVPGIPPKSLDVRVEGDTLMVEISATDENHSENVKSRIRLPDGIDVENIKADYENGVLKVTVPYAEKEKHTIKVNFSESEKVLESSNQ